MADILSRELLDTLGASGVQGICVYSRGAVAAEHFFVPLERRNQYSASKSFTSAAIGCGIAEGLLSLDERIVDILGEYVPEKHDANLEKTTVRDCLMMACGHSRSYLMMETRMNQRDVNWCEFAMSQPFPNTPGTVMVYDNSSTYLAAASLQKRAGENLTDYLMPRLFEPLHIPRPDWEFSPEGFILGASSLMIDVRELMRFGVMLLDRGVYEGKTVVPSDWIDAATAVQITGGGAGEFGYGYQFWRGRHDSFRADGAFGQLCIVYPERGVVAINSHSSDSSAIIAAVDEHIYPCL